MFINNLEKSTNICKTLISPETIESMLKFSAVDSVGLPFSVFTQLLSKSRQKNPDVPGKAIQGHVFWGHWKGEEGLKALYNNFGFGLIF